jgi:hypothetical protein
MSSARDVTPWARAADLAVEELLDETLVYDLARHKAHSLNRTATLVWRQCDGKTTVAAMAVRLARELDLPVNEDLVWVALERLRRTHLLAEGVIVPPESAGYSRRDALRALGLTAALPVIVSILAPRAARAQSCVSDCSGLPDCIPCQQKGRRV